MNARIHQLPLHSADPIPTRDQRDWVTSAELIGDTGITYRQLDYWTRTGLLTPIDGANPGSGWMRRYDHAQLERARALRDLLDGGITLTTCRQVIDEFVTTGHAHIGHITITRADQAS